MGGTSIDLPLLQTSQASFIVDFLLSRVRVVFCGCARRWQIVILMGLFCGVQQSAVWAAEWSLLPSIGVKGVYNSNLLLTPLPHNETYGYWVSPAAELSGKTERLEVSSRLAADFVSYYGGEETRFTNIFLPLTLRYKTEKDVLGFTGGFIRDNTLMNELLATGLVLRFTQRNQWTANPSWTRSITEKLSVQSSFQLNDTTYENGLSLGLVDYQLFGGSGGLLYQLSEQDQIQLAGSYSNFHTTNASSPFRASIPGVNLSLTHAFTETLTGTASGGPSFVSSTSQTASDSITAQNTVWLFGGKLTKKFERASVQVSVSRNIVPSGFGRLIQTDRAGLTVSHDLTETLTASLDGSGYIVSDTTQRASTFPENRYFSATPTIAWKFSEWWKLELSYAYRHRAVDGVSDSAMSNAITFMLTYYPPKLAFSN
jgi:hypothetical protein